MPIEMHRQSGFFQCISMKIEFYVLFADFRIVLLFMSNLIILILYSVLIGCFSPITFHYWIWAAGHNVIVNFFWTVSENDLLWRYNNPYSRGRSKPMKLSLRGKRKLPPKCNSFLFRQSPSYDLISVTDC